MPRVRLDMGPTGTNRVSLDGQHDVRHWRAEFGNAVNASPHTSAMDRNHPYRRRRQELRSILSRV